MFKFFRKKEQPIEEKVEEQPIKFRAEEALMDNPSFSVLLQLNQDTGEYIFAIDANDKSISSAEMTATLICNLVHGELNEVLIDAISNYAETEEEQMFTEATLTFWKEYEIKIMEALQEQVKELEKEKKRKIDPTRIFNIRGEKNER
jgi:hypothetical protein